MEIKIEITCSCGNKSMVQLFSGQKDYTCDACDSELFKAHISTGYVYILSNPAMPNLLKIGFTERDVDERVEELNSTGVPVPFEVEAIFGSQNAYEDEQAIHNILNQHRLANNREFFTLDIKNAVQTIISHLSSEPSFLKSPELLMNDTAREAFQHEKIENEIVKLQELRNEYVNLISQKEWDGWIDLILLKTNYRKFETGAQKERYQRSMINKMLIDHFRENDEIREALPLCLDRLESLLTTKESWEHGL